jgi:hypothetical protein
MQLIQIGEIKQKTIMDLIQEMAANQFSEIERLKAAARAKATDRRTRYGRSRCSSSDRRR